jgi:cation diffusion facilitator CzcD-associated flavoprotein CzcO
MKGAKYRRRPAVEPHMSGADHETDVVVIGAGQAGLSAAYHLRRAGFANNASFVVLDHGKRAGGAWQYRWPSLVLGKVHGIYDLPGMAFGSPDVTRPASEVVSEYFARFESVYDLPVFRPVDVQSVTRAGERLVVSSPAESWAARAVISATGTWDRPFWPRYPARRPSPAVRCTRRTTPAPKTSAAGGSSWSVVGRRPFSYSWSSPRSPARRRG